MKSSIQNALNERLSTAEKVFAKKPLTEFLNTPTFLDGSVPTTTLHSSCTYNSSNQGSFDIVNATNVELTAASINNIGTNNIGTSNNITVSSIGTNYDQPIAVGPYVGDTPINYWTDPYWLYGWHWDWRQPYPVHVTEWRYINTHNFTKEDADKMLKDIENIVKNVPNKIEKDLSNSGGIPTNIFIDNSKRFYIDIALAGYSKEEIKVYFENDYIIVDLKTKPENTEYAFIQKGIKNKEETLSFYLDTDKWDKTKINSEFKDGLLHIMVEPKKQEDKRVEIQVE